MSQKAIDRSDRFFLSLSYGSPFLADIVFAWLGHLFFEPAFALSSSGTLVLSVSCAFLLATLMCGLQFIVEVKVAWTDIAYIWLYDLVWALLIEARFSYERS